MTRMVPDGARNRGEADNRDIGAAVERLRGSHPGVVVAVAVLPAVVGSHAAGSRAGQRRAGIGVKGHRIAGSPKT